ncbi:terminase [Nocardia sp. NPDC059246]|uniref:terminase n=1 Tax=unclassified Nocardia TaxID=2637762 RepID=UPI003692DB6A
MPKIWLPNPPPGSAICLGFDGSENNDWTALRGETRAGLQFTPRYGPDRRPTIWNPDDWGGRIPRGEVHAAISEVFRTWSVARMYADPYDWRSEIGDWALEYGDEHVVEWPTNRVTPMYGAIRRFEIDLKTGRIQQDGCPIAAAHIANCRRVAKPGDKYVLGKPADHQKIDAAITSILAHEAASDAREAGWEDVDSRMFCFS